MQDWCLCALAVCDKGSNFGLQVDLEALLSITYKEELEHKAGVKSGRETRVSSDRVKLDFVHFLLRISTLQGGIRSERSRLKLLRNNALR